MASIDEQFVEYIVKNLVDNPGAVKIERRVDEKGVLLELTVDPADIGRVIGKRGSTAQSLRTLLRALGTKNDARYNLKIIDIDKPESERNPSREASAEPGPAVETSDSSNASAETGDGTASSFAPQTDDSVNEVENSAPETVENDSDLAKKTRQELADLDDLDI
ncbi:MAG: KH domain-containing protein [Candidatus Nomurabacteria bacterium]|jgi:predicted RNA-binding protein YlqC (UPF0109 family)|nr:KH domain-containing protein [Candidatus Nomurabacteria bacterium]